MALPVKEIDIQKSIMDYLSVKKILAIRVNSGTASVSERGKQYWMRLAPKGTSDIIGCLPDGRFFAIEVKTLKGNVTDEQKTFLARVELQGGIALVARSIDDVDSMLRQYGY